MKPAEQELVNQKKPMIKPMFIIAHELYDALPIHQFKYLGNENWSEMSVQLKSQKDRQVD